MSFKDDQKRMQYDNEIRTEYKRTLNFSPFEEGLNKLTQSRLQALHTMIFEQPIEAVQSAIQGNKLTCEELVLYYLHRIKTYNNRFNVVLELNPKALIQAKALDEKIKQEINPASLYGTTVLLKDNIGALDMHVAAGTYALRNTTTDRDAFLVDLLRKEDCIVLGKANLSEWSNFMSEPSSNGFSLLGGQTKNPYGKFDVGGSSSGPSVAVAINLSTFSIGSETCGSLIYPAGQNSIVTLKPTTGLISRDLIVPITEAQDTAGVMSRRVSDLKVVFKTLVVKDSNDPKGTVVDHIIKETKLEVGYLMGKTFGVVNTESSEMKAIIKEFESQGARVIPITLPEGDSEIDMLTVLLYGIKQDVNTFLNQTSITSEFKSLKDIVSYYKNNPCFMPYGQDYLEQGDSLEMTKEAYQALVKKNEQIAKKVLDRSISDNKLDGILSISNELAVYYSVAGYPAITIPSGYTEEGEPYNVTIVGGYMDDFKLIKVAYGYEQATKHREILDVDE